MPYVYALWHNAVAEIDREQVARQLANVPDENAVLDQASTGADGDVRFDGERHAARMLFSADDESGHAPITTLRQEESRSLASFRQAARVEYLAAQRNEAEKLGRSLPVSIVTLYSAPVYGPNQTQVTGNLAPHGGLLGRDIAHALRLRHQHR